MATMEELANTYVNKILKSRNRKEVVNEIIKEINSLTYSTTKKPISQEDVDKLIKLIKDILKSQVSLEEQTFSKTYRNYEHVLGNTDTSGFNEIIDMLTKGTQK